MCAGESESIGEIECWRVRSWKRESVGKRVLERQIVWERECG